ncbi:HAMP domain-containing sensor histidine kinase [Roseateles sp. SL47]|uniref:sensor histidine kinase n=1 Tax=Roseateles sp. SL47 TaxID=2995138 RepID=UPI0022720501|nr:HAMP domain-containing sensor histidine kinase [Roseateles sp. SL47]WAC73522.1 HAMP domain-containing sensor histidine kinase [Roseateles sp. SL47]
MATSGKRHRRWLQRVIRWDFTLRNIFWLSLLVVFLAGAVLDVSISAREKEHRVQESELRGQLAQFLLSIREPDGSTLLENPQEFSAVSRPLSVVTLRRSFFTYLLQTGNARTFQVGDINFEAPRACQVEFPGVQGDSLHACFAAVPGDQAGRYIYFSLRYPSSKIQRHRSGRPLSEVNRVVLTFGGAKESRLTLAYQVPPLARSRYPSQLSRFTEVHEVTAFASGEGGQPSRLVSGQAFERPDEEEGRVARNFVTVVGRLDAALLQPSAQEDDWPSAAAKKVVIGVKVYDKGNSDDEPQVRFDVPPGRAGTPLVSLTQAYLAAVPSRASLQVSAPGPGNARRILWRSDDAGISQSTTRLEGLWQSLADGWSELIISKTALQAAPISASQAVRMPRVGNASATLTATPFTLPDLATRAFIWVSAAFVVIVILAGDWSLYVWKLRALRSTAYSMAVRPSSGGDLQKFAAKNEIGTLGRVFNILLKRNRSRDENLVKRLKAAEARRAEGLRLAEAHVQNRKAILDAIGHEIRAPLQSLLNTTKEDPAVQEKLARIRRAVEALHEATSVEDGLRSGEIAMEPHDLADWLQRFANNLVADGRSVVYVGPSTPVIVDIDSIQLWRILDNLLDNAERYRIPGTDIELRLVQYEDDVTVEVFNQGPAIPAAHLERIFDLGVSDSNAQGSSGLGLFASRIYGLAMRLTLHARNKENGVSLVLQFPRLKAE